MRFDPDNKVVQLCAQGMELEATEGSASALSKFIAAWNTAVTDEEKFIAAHYIARHQLSVENKLGWDKTALNHALKAGEQCKPHLPSLYLNIAKCYEDIGNYQEALNNYKLALLFNSYLSDDGYGSMIKAGIENGLVRIKYLTGVE